jgi:hypothetical protein
LNREETVRFTAKLVIAPNKAAGGAVAGDGRAAAAGAAVQVVVVATATGIAGGTKILRKAIRLRANCSGNPWGCAYSCMAAYIS